MTSEATAKIISKSGLAATELTPFAASAAVGDAASLRTRIECLQRVPALREFARAAIHALEDNGTPSSAEHLGRCLENLQAATTALLRHLHRSDALQSLGSQYALWVKFPSGLTLPNLTKGLSRAQSALGTLGARSEANDAIRVEAVDTSPLSFRVGIKTRRTCQLIGACIGAARSILAGLDGLRASASHSGTDSCLDAMIDRAASQIATSEFADHEDPTLVFRVRQALREFIFFEETGIEFHPTLQTPDDIRLLITARGQRVCVPSESPARRDATEDALDH